MIKWIVKQGKHGLGGLQIIYYPKNATDWRQAISISENTLKNTFEVADIMNPPNVEIESFKNLKDAKKYVHQLKKSYKTIPSKKDLPFKGNYANPQPKGWRYEPARHALAAKKIKTGRKKK